MPSTILGLPIHPLIVHAVVVLVPLAALLLVASAVSSRFRCWARVATPAVALGALALVPLATNSGEGLERRVPPSALVEQHAQLGDTLLPLMLGVSVLALALSWLDRRAGRGAGGQRLALVGVSVLAVVVASGTLVQVVRIGHSGARAVWSHASVGNAAGSSEGGSR